MNKLIEKELKLAASPLTYLFVIFAAMTLLPGYPILMGAFFICFGIFQSFQSAREANDILYSALLPIKKSDVVKSKYLFTMFFQLIGFALTFILVIIRMTAMSNVGVYLHNPLMNANFTYLAYTLIIFAAFNGIFLKGFFRSAYYYGKPFIIFIIAALLIVGIGETLFHIPGLSALNSGFGNQFHIQLIIFIASILIYVGITFLSYKSAQKSFNKIDL